MFLPDIKLSYNVCYIVCGVVVERGRVLLVQEAKPSCRGKWYLPAGRMEKNETIVVRSSLARVSRHDNARGGLLTESFLPS